MKFASTLAALIVAVLLSGCASTQISLRSGSAAPTRSSAPVPGSSYSSAAIHAEARPNAYFALLFLGYFAAGVQDSYLRWNYGPAWRDPPQLAGDRAIAEHDCSRPMQRPSANLRCK